MKRFFADVTIAATGRHEGATDEPQESDEDAAKNQDGCGEIRTAFPGIAG